MSRKGGDNHFISARERDLKPLRAESLSALELDGERRGLLEAFLERAWLMGTQSGHAKMLNEAIRQREQHSGGRWEPPVGPIRTEEIEAQFKAMMESSAEALDLPPEQAVALWDLLTRAWTAGIQTYESEVVASLIERRSDIAEEAQSWLGDEAEG